jgi:hypothetical protein
MEPLLTPQQRELLGAFGIDLSKLMWRRSCDCLARSLTNRSEATEAAMSGIAGELERFATSELNEVETSYLAVIIASKFRRLEHATNSG